MAAAANSSGNRYARRAPSCRRCARRVHPAERRTANFGAARQRVVQREVNACPAAPVDAPQQRRRTWKRRTAARDTEVDEQHHVGRRAASSRAARALEHVDFADLLQPILLAAAPRHDDVGVHVVRPAPAAATPAKAAAHAASRSHAAHAASSRTAPSRWLFASSRRATAASARWARMARRRRRRRCADLPAPRSSHAARQQARSGQASPSSGVGGGRCRRRPPQPRARRWRWRMARACPHPLRRELARASVRGLRVYLLAQPLADWRVAPYALASSRTWMAKARCLRGPSRRSRPRRPRRRCQRSARVVLEEEMVGLVGDLRRSRLARAQQNGGTRRRRPRRTHGPRPSTAGHGRRAPRAAPVKWLLTSGVQPELGPPGARTATARRRSRPRAPPSTPPPRLRGDALRRDALRRERGGAGPLPARADAGHPGRGAVHGGVGGDGGDGGGDDAAHRPGGVATPGVGGTPPSAKDSPTAAPSAPAAPGRRRRPSTARAAPASAAVELFCGAARASAGRPRPRPPATTGPSCAPAERPAAVAAGRGRPGVSPAATTWSRRPAPRRRPSSPPKTSVVDADRAYALRLGIIGGGRRWAPRSACAARRSTRRRDRGRPLRAGARAPPLAPPARAPPVSNTKSCRREIAPSPRSALRSRPLVTAPSPRSATGGVRWRVRLLRGGDVLSPTLSCGGGATR